MAPRGKRRRGSGGDRIADSDLIALAATRLAASLSSLDAHWTIAVGVVALDFAAGGVLVAIDVWFQPFSNWWPVIIPAFAGTIAGILPARDAVLFAGGRIEYGPDHMQGTFTGEVVALLDRATSANREAIRTMRDSVLWSLAFLFEGLGAAGVYLGFRAYILTFKTSLAPPLGDHPYLSVTVAGWFVVATCFLTIVLGFMRLYAPKGKALARFFSSLDDWYGSLDLHDKVRDWLDRVGDWLDAKTAPVDGWLEAMIRKRRRRKADAHHREE